MSDNNLDVDDDEPAPKLELDYAPSDPLSQRMRLAADPPMSQRRIAPRTPRIQPVDRPTRWPWYLLLLAIVGGGAALEKTEHGAFFRHTIDALAHADERALLTQDTITAVHALLGADTLDKGNEALAAIDGAVARAPRHKQLLAHAAHTVFAYELRFGHNAHHEQAIEWLKRAGNDPATALAIAARDVVDKAPNARDSIARAGAESEAKLLLGMISTGPDAIHAFEEAAKSDPTIRTRAALARALEPTDPGRAREVASAIAADSPTHVGARLILGRAAYLAHDASTLARYVTELTPLEKQATFAEKSELFTLRGLHALEKGDAAAARVAFDESAKLGKPSALNGLGLARALIALGKMDDARATLDAITDPALTTEVSKLRGLTNVKPKK